MAWASRSSPKAWKPPSRSRCSAAWSATRRRVTTSESPRTPSGSAPPSSPEFEHDAPRPGALLLDLRHPHRPDLARVRDVRSAAGLEVDAFNVEQPDAPHAARRLHRHGAHELGFRVELLVGDPHRAHVVRFV